MLPLSAIKTTNSNSTYMMRYYITIFFYFFAISISAQTPPKFDASYPDVHDPVMAHGEDGRFYIFSTGMGISVMSSSDMKEWRQEKSVFSVTMKGRDGKEHHFEGNTAMPKWTTDSVPGFRGHFWAPDISFVNGKWHLYYSCSTFGKNGSAIGLATNKTLDPTSPYYKWEDQGPVVVSHRNKDNWNAIDPNLSLNTPPSGVGGLLFYGSFWDGIQIVALEDNLKDIKTTPTTIARRFEPLKNNATFADPAAFNIEEGDSIEAGFNAIEAPFVIKRGDWYYLFVSWDYCCQGKNSTYKTVYGRSRNIEGPYLDKEGHDMAFGGGTYLVGPDDKFFGIGHCSAYQFDGNWYFLSHAYDIEKNGQAKLFIRQFTFDDDGWIVMDR